jgi:hypothetical protein
LKVNQIAREFQYQKMDLDFWQIIHE